MTNLEWLTCDQPDLMLEELMGQVPRAQLVEFVQACWQRIGPYLPATPHSYTVVEQFAAIVDGLNDHDAVVYAAEAALKAAGLAPSLRMAQL
ncbi:MAG: hypothetical protein ACJ8C4_17905 [Gemmataceae bacterium]